MQAKHSKWTQPAMALAIALLPACGDDDNIAGPTAATEFELVAGLGDAYYTNYTTPSGLGVNITASAVYDILTDGDPFNDFVVLDWRSAEHFALGHIEGAQNVSVTQFEAVVDGLASGRTVLNVCYTGQIASHATAYMNMLGVEAQNLKFGMCGWTSDTAVNLAKWDNAISDDYASWLTEVESTPSATFDYPALSTGEPTAERILMARAQAYLTAGWKQISVAALYEDIETNQNGADYFVVNYFDPAQYNAGHIPGAVRFQPKQDLRTDARLSSLPTDKKIVVYCFTGQTSSQVVAYLNALGYDAYSLVFGVNAMCHSNGQICTIAYHAATTDYPVSTE